MPSEHPNELTDARNAVWDAIEGIEAITWKAKFKFDSTENGSRETEPSISQVPAVAIQTLTVTPDWSFQRTIIPYLLLVRVWTPHWNLDTAEQYVCRIMKTVRADAEVKKYKPEFRIAIGLTSLQGATGPKVVRADIQITLTNCLI